MDVPGTVLSVRDSRTGPCKYLFLTVDDPGARRILDERHGSCGPVDAPAWDGPAGILKVKLPARRGRVAPSFYCDDGEVTSWACLRQGRDVTVSARFAGPWRREGRGTFEGEVSTGYSWVCDRGVIHGVGKFE